MKRYKVAFLEYEWLEIFNETYFIIDNKIHFDYVSMFMPFGDSAFIHLLDCVR